MRIGVVISKASNLTRYELKHFSSPYELIEYMRTHSEGYEWILSIKDGDDICIGCGEKYKELLGECDLYVDLTLYDYYIE